MSPASAVHSSAKPNSNDPEKAESFSGFGFFVLSQALQFFGKYFTDWIMGKGRLEAFSDGVIAIIITIMVLEMKVPHGSELADLATRLPVFLSYVLSFVYIGIYWNNHHHLIKAVKQVTGGIMWANLHLLFWLSLVPFATGWMGENHFAATPSALYGCVMLLSAIAYYILQRLILCAHGTGSDLVAAFGGDWKGKLSPVVYLIAIPLAYVNNLISIAIYAAVAVIWVVPDRRIAKAIQQAEH